MKRLFFLVIAFMALTVRADAQKRSLEQMEEIAMQALGVSDDQVNVNMITRAVSPAVTVSMNSPQLAVFNKANGGWVMVSADERTYTILAYSTEGQFEWESAPDNVKGWVEDYQNQIDSLDAYDFEYVSPATAVTAGSPVVGPLVTTKWGQKVPYNNNCPMGSNNNRSVTGCVATAMAQIMNFWKYNTDCERGIHTNVFCPDFTVDFSQSVYDWNNMSDDYPSQGKYNTQKQNDAVAKLMYDCGIAIDMNYSPSESGAFTARAQYIMPAYFGYSTDITCYDRDSYGSSGWDAMLKKELDAKRPILYSGHNSSGGGHAFVCDGYDSEGLFHFNWGWDGSNNGYFQISVLNPGSYDYSSDQSACVNIKPASANDKAIWQNGFCFGKTTDGKYRLLTYNNNRNISELVTPQYVEVNGKRNSYIIPNLFLVSNDFLTSVEFNGATEIGVQALQDCLSLKTVSFTDKTTKIKGYALNKNTNLETIHIGKNVSSVGNNAFEKSQNLRDVYCYPTTAPSVNSTAFNDCPEKSKITIHVPSGRKNAYSSWGQFGTIVSDIPTGAGNPKQDDNDGTWYNLMGVPVNNTATPGIYIQDGRKYIF